MPTTLPINRQHKYPELALYTHLEGKLTNAYVVRYQVYDDSAGYPGTLLLPTSGSTTVTTGAGNFDTGCYGVYDPLTGLPWVPLAAMTRGRVVWSYRWAAGGELFTVERAFEVVEASVTQVPADNLFLIQDFKDALGAITPPANDRDTFQLIKFWTERIQRYCRTDFFLRKAVKRFRWRPSTSLLFDVPLFAMKSMTEDESVTAIDNDDLVVWTVSDDPGNTKIEMRTSETPGFGPIRMGVARVDGVWGYVDPETLGPPYSLQDTAVTTVARVYASSTGTLVDPVGIIKREETDGHEIEYAVVSTEVRSGLLALLKSIELRDQLDMYRAPIGIAMTGAT
jgi:hypothetical protein